MIKLIAALFFLLSISGSAQEACFKKVHNRGMPKRDVVAEIIKWAKRADDSVFTVNSRYDIYSSVAPQLGPWKSLTHRKAALVNVLIVLAGYESSWRWNAGIDTTNASSYKNKCKEEAGLLQASGNSLNFGQPLKDLFNYHCKGAAGRTVCEKFITCSKSSHQYVIAHTAQLLRYTTKHHGPVLRKEINKWLSRECVTQIEGML